MRRLTLVGVAATLMILVGAENWTLVPRSRRQSLLTGSIGGCKSSPIGAGGDPTINSGR